MFIVMEGDGSRSQSAGASSAAGTSSTIDWTHEWQLATIMDARKALTPTEIDTMDNDGITIRRLQERKAWEHEAMIKMAHWIDADSTLETGLLTIWRYIGHLRWRKSYWSRKPCPSFNPTVYLAKAIRSKENYIQPIYYDYLYALAGGPCQESAVVWGPYNKQRVGELAEMRQDSPAITGLYAKLQQALAQGVSSSPQRSILVAFGWPCINAAPPKLDAVLTTTLSTFAIGHIGSGAGVAGPDQLAGGISDMPGEKADTENGDDSNMEIADKETDMAPQQSVQHEKPAIPPPVRKLRRRQAEPVLQLDALQTLGGERAQSQWEDDVELKVLLVPQMEDLHPGVSEQDLQSRLQKAQKILDSIAHLAKSDDTVDKDFYTAKANGCARLKQSLSARDQHRRRQVAKQRLQEADERRRQAQSENTLQEQLQQQQQQLDDDIGSDKQGKRPASELARSSKRQRFDDMVRDVLRERCAEFNVFPLGQLENLLEVMGKDITAANEYIGSKVEDKLYRLDETMIEKVDGIVQDITDIKTNMAVMNRALDDIIKAQQGIVSVLKNPDLWTDA